MLSEAAVLMWEPSAPQTHSNWGTEVWGQSEIWVAHYGIYYFPPASLMQSIKSTQSMLPLGVNPS